MCPHNRGDNTSRRLSLAIALVLILGTIWLYAPIFHYDYINFDDGDYVTKNVHVRSGLIWENVAWAFTAFYASNWHPLTWISHMLDVQLFGLNPGASHVINLLFHIINTGLVFALFVGMSKNLWRSAFVAAVFGWHPLHVESVAWIAERKDLLSAFCGLLSILIYTRYVRSPHRKTYLLLILCYALGLMSKPMLVSLPLLLLLLDYWPLQRAKFGPTEWRNWIPLFKDKIPLIGLALCSSVITLLAQRSGGALVPLNEVSLITRIGNGLLSYVAYVNKSVLPVQLAIFYPLRLPLPLWSIISAIVFLGTITAIVLRKAQRFPYLLTGWFWFIITLLPVIGLVRVGDQAMADRYMYLPLIGLAILIAWGIPDLLRATAALNQIANPLLAVGTTFALLACATLTARQRSYWKDSIALFEHTLAITPDNWYAENNLCGALLDQGKIELARSHAAEALRIRPDYPEAHMNLGVALVRLGRTFAALEEMEKACALRPNSPVTHDNLGSALVVAGRIDEAIPHFSEALRLNPNSLQALKALGWIRATQPDSANGNADEALRLATRAVQITGSQDPVTLDLLAAALAHAGRFDEAIKVADRARALATAQNQPVIARQINEHLDFYRLGLPYLTKSRRSNAGAFGL